MQVQLLPKRGLGIALIYSLLTLVSSLPSHAYPALRLEDCLVQTRLVAPCPSPTPGVHSDSCLSSQ